LPFNPKQETFAVHLGRVLFWNIYRFEMADKRDGKKIFLLWYKYFFHQIA